METIQQKTKFNVTNSHLSDTSCCGHYSNMYLRLSFATFSLHVYILGKVQSLFQPPSFRYIASKYKKQDWTGLSMSTVSLKVYTCISTINV